MSIEARGISKRFGSFPALDDVSLTVGRGELVALLGPSGSGKTTLLRIIAGLDRPDAGTVLFSGEDASSRSLRDRQVGFVFQHYALFRHMSVFENVAFGLRVRPRATRPSNPQIHDRVMELLSLVQLDVLAHRKPSELSGGQRQRVALARALAVEPEVLLLDEPFGALDATVRKELRRWLRRLHDDLRIASVFVTHDQEEALEVADRVVIMNHGKIEQDGTPDQVYEHPATPFVAGFLGSVNLFHGRVHMGQATLGPLALQTPEHAGTVDTPAVGYVRPHDLDILTDPGDGGAVAAIVRHIASHGPAVRVDLERIDNGAPVEALISRERLAELQIRPGDRAYLRPTRLRLFLEDYSI